MLYTKDQFRLETIKYLAEHWMDDMIAEEMADVLGYSIQYFNLKFKESFGIPFLQYYKKFRLHRTAKEMSDNNTLTNMAALAGYGTAQAFSKAFRKEFGLSPKQFLESDMEIPDMPVCCEIGGYPVSVEYRQTERKIVRGSLVTPVNENHTDLQKEVGYYFDYMMESDCLEEGEKKVELWWNDEQFNIRYFIGEEKEGDALLPPEMTEIVIPEDYYAVISVGVDREGNRKKISSAMKELIEYIFGEWYLANKKATKKMGIIFETYEKNRITVYVPMYKRQSVTPIKKLKFKGSEAWIRYIDEHLTQGLTVAALAENFFYSERHFTNTFELYFGIRPGRYMKKRKMYLAASELKNRESDISRIVEKYGFSSMMTFENDFIEEFGCYPMEYNGEEYKAENLRQYYEIYKQTILVSYVELEDMYVAGEDLLARTNYEEDSGDLVESIACLLREEEYKDVEEQIGDIRVVVWQTIESEMGTNEPTCLIGPEISSQGAFSSKYHSVKIIGGSYAMIESLNPYDKDSLAEIYRNLYRCSFDGWLRSNQEKIDLERITFIRYFHGKLYFYIPIKM